MRIRSYTATLMGALAKHRRRQGAVVSAAVALLIVAVVIVDTLTTGPTVPGQLPPCLYTRDGISGLERAAKLLHIQGNCALIFHRAAPDWAAWTTPWFINQPGTNNDWARWAHQRGNRLVITVGLIPASAAQQDWRALGAAGAYDGYARALAANLVRSGLGNATIRLSNEANGTWFIDNLGSTLSEVHDWVRFWRNAVSAMRRVPGARFGFDWTIADEIGAGGLALFYPGDRFVSYIGDDVYDVGQGLTPAQRWARLISGPRGVRAVVAFARAHHKPFSIPEWGLQSGPTGGGDNPLFVDDISALARSSGFGYQAYFFAGDGGTLLSGSPQSLAAYRRDFGRGR